MEYFLGLCFHGIASPKSVKVDIQITLRILIDKKATVASNEVKKSSMVESVKSKITSALHLPDIVRRGERKIGRCCTTDEGLRDVVAFDCVRFLNLQDQR